MSTEVDYVGMFIHYDRSGKSVQPEALSGKKVQSVYLTCAALGSANTWGTVLTAATQVSSANGQLEPNHSYAIAWVYAYSANGVAVSLKHADWAGVSPGGMMAQTVSQRKCLLDFARHHSIPVIRANSPLDVWIYAAGTDTPVIWLGLVDLGENFNAQDGLEDFVLAKATVTNGAGLTALAAVSPNSLTVQDGRGTPTLTGAFVTGTAPLRGQLRSTDRSMQPNPVELPPVATIAGDYINEIRLPDVPLTITSVITPYASA